MKIFELIQKHYGTLGIIFPSNQSLQKYPFIKRVLFGFLLFAYYIVSQCVYTFYMASGFMGYVDSVSSLAGNNIGFISFTTIVLKRRLLFKCIDNMEKLMEISKIQLRS